jgi:hypothetical protein
MFYGRNNPLTLLVIGAIASAYGIYLIKRGIEGDTLLPGTNFTYLPRWLFIAVGALLQVSLPGAYLFLRSQGHFG